MTEGTAAMQRRNGDGSYGRRDGNGDGRHDANAMAMTAMDGAAATGGKEATMAR
jgi:hypothetical protein